MSRIASLDVSKEVEAIDGAAGLSDEQEERLEKSFSKAKARAQEIKSEKRSSGEDRAATELLVQTDDEVHAVLNCEQREAYRKHRRDQRWKHLQQEISLGKPTPRARWNPSDAQTRVEQMTSNMNLSEQQAAEIDKIYTDAKLEWGTVETLTDQERRARTVELHFRTQDELYAVLSCAQREELRKAKQSKATGRRRKRPSTN